VRCLPFLVCAAVGLCVFPMRADTHGPLSAAAATEMWHDAKVREKLQCAGVVGGYYRATDAGGQVLVEAELLFRGGGRIRYRKYHSKRLGFPTVIDLVKVRLRLRQG